MSTELQAAAGLLEPVRPDFDRVRVIPDFSFDRECGFALQQLAANSFALGVAMRNPASLRSAIVNVAAIGISLNPACKHAYLVPRDGKICLDVSYMGLLYLAQSSGAIQWGQCFIVRAGDEFKRTGVDTPPLHAFDEFAPDEERGPIVGAYSVVKTSGGDYLTHAMKIAAIHRIRDRSPAAQKKSGPWFTDPEEMIKKTVIKQGAKYWTQAGSGRLNEALAYLNNEAGEGIEIDVTPSKNPPPSSDETTSQIVAELELIALNDGQDAFRCAWRALTEAQKINVGLDERNRLDQLAAGGEQ